MFFFFRILSWATLFSTFAAQAAVLPYTNRTKAYSGWGTTVRGDLSTIGMSGAVVAIPVSISSVESNPAGLTMTMGSVSAQINSNSLEDKRVSGNDTMKVKSSQWGLAVNPPPWGFAISYYTPSFEGGNYATTTNSQIKNYELSLKQLRLSASRSLLNSKLSVGVSLELNHSIRKVGDNNTAADQMAYKLGAIYKLEKRFLLGMAFSPPSEVGAADPTSTSNQFLPGFVQPVKMPMLLTLGTGWIPNRYFRAGFAIIAAGKSENTALLRDQNLNVGKDFTLQPRVGASYIIGEYKFIKIETFAGSYYETSRIEGLSNRLHGTFGLQVNPWFVNTGFGVDKAKNFDNVFVSIGIDIVRTLRTFDIIPKDPTPPLKGFWPKPTEMKTDGLSAALREGEVTKSAPPSVGDVSEIISNIPNRFKKKINDEDPDETPPPKKKSKQIRQKKRRAQPSQ